MFDYLTKNINLKIFLPSLLIYILGLISIVSTTQGLYQNHVFNLIVGLTLFFILQIIDVEFYVKQSLVFYIIVSALLVLIFIIGHTALGASRWLKIGALTIQPSEMAKIVLIFVNTKIFLNKFKLEFKKFKLKNIYLQSLLISGPLIFLVIIQPDLGTTIAMTLIYLSLITITHFRKFWFLLIFILISILSTPLYNSLQDYQKERILVFINPEADPYGSGYNSIQAEIAVGSGGVFGKGYQRGTQTQLNFLPIFWTDFLIATFAEEWGMLGLIVLISLYSFLIYQIYVVFLKTQSASFKFIALGIFTYFSAQFIINFGMNIGLLPVTGIPVPLFSYGGTSLVSSFILLAIINKISIDKSKF